MDRPTVRQLEALVAVADHGSFRRAATSLGISQPALSAQVQAAEEVLGVQVFERDRYRVMADENRINLRLLVPPRGRIVDRFGVSLADNRQNYRVVIVPEQTSDINATLDAIARLIDVSEADRKRAFVLRADGSVISQQYADVDKARIYPGDTIVVPPVIDKRAILQRIVDIATIIGQVGLGVATIAILSR